MPDQDQPPAVPRPEDWVRRAHLFWRMILFLPFVYAGIAAFVQDHWFRAEYPDGFWPISDHALLVFTFAFAAAALVAQLFVVAIRHRFGTRLEAAAKRPHEIGRLIWRRTCWIAAMADFVSLLGLALFLFRGQWYCLIGFCIASYLIYAQAAPDGRYADMLQAEEEDRI